MKIIVNKLKCLDQKVKDLSSTTRSRLANAIDIEELQKEIAEYRTNLSAYSKRTLNNK